MIINYSSAKIEDIPQLVSLMNSEYKRKKDENYFIWQYFSAPIPTTLICAYHEKKIIGMFGLQIKKLNTDKKIGQIIDILILPEYRKKGIFKEMANLAFRSFDDINLYCVFPNSNGKYSCEKSLGFKTICKMNSLILDISNYQYPIKTLFKPLDDILLLNFKSDHKYSKWRFFSSPCYKYKKIILGKNNYAISKIFVDPINQRKIGDIVKIKARENENQVTLIKTIINDFIAKKINIITTWALPHTQLYNTLLSLNFKEESEERYFCVKSNNNEEIFYEINNWELSQSDTEIF